MRHRNQLLFLIVLGLVTAAARPAGAANSCYECHSALGEDRLAAPARKYAKSVHRHDGVGCVGCHGGNPEDSTAKAHDRERGFVGRPARADIPKICGGCHADARVIRRYSALLPLDQLQLYESSHHGQRVLKEGNAKAPVCSTCHGEHDVLPVSDPRSPVRREQVAKLCGGCHGDAQRMGKFNIPTDQLPKWTRSAHGKAIARGDLRAPACPQCHGAHGAIPPAVDTVGQVCGQCHVDELAAFDKGPHSKAYRKLGFAECLPCHGSHDLPAARPIALGLDSGAACGKCHKSDTRPRQVAIKLTELVKQATERAAAAERHVKLAEREGLFVPGTGAALVEMKTAVEHLRPALHSLDPKALEQPVGLVRAAADKAEKIIARARAVRDVERRGYFVVVGLIAALLLLLLEKGRRVGAWRTRQ